MRAGKLDRLITIQRFTNTVDDFGTPVEAWADVATLRAQIVTASTDEFISHGAEAETVIVFRARYVAGITAADRIVYGGAAHNIKELTEIGRRRGLELRCVRVS